MTVKLLLLKSGEDVVADVREMVVPDREDKMVVGYYLDSPHRVKLIADVPKDGTTQHRSRIQMIPWLPLSKDRTIPIPSDWVVTIVEPHDEVKDMLIKRLEEINEAETVSTDEQSESVDSD